MKKSRKVKELEIFILTYLYREFFRPIDSKSRRRHCLRRLSVSKKYFRPAAQVFETLKKLQKLLISMVRDTLLGFPSHTPPYRYRKSCHLIGLAVKTAAGIACGGFSFGKDHSISRRLADFSSLAALGRINSSTPLSYLALMAEVSMPVTLKVRLYAP